MVNQEDPRIALMNFLKSLPSSIKIDEYYFIIIMCIGEEPPDDYEEFQAIVERYLSGAGFAGLGAIICCKVILDRRLSRMLGKLNKAEKDLKEITASNPNFSQDPLLSIPLTKRYYAEALKKWNVLLRSALSDENIAYFEQNPDKLLLAIKTESQ